MMPADPAPDRARSAEIEQVDRFLPRYDKDGLVAAVATDWQSGEVLMLAWMNAEAVARTLETGFAHFWSRSRCKLWLKGEESGNRLEVVEARTDCDQDALWLRVRVAGDGVACHTGERTCFYRSVRSASPTSDGAIRLERIIGSQNE
jgi:phosphoribosyl-AMP cyclohydrolase